MIRHIVMPQEKIQEMAIVTGLPEEKIQECIVIAVSIIAPAAEVVDGEGVMAAIKICYIIDLMLERPGLLEGIWGESLGPKLKPWFDYGKKTFH